MDPRERVLAVLDRKPVDRLPVDLWHVEEVGQALRRRFEANDDLELYRRMGLDKIVWVFIEYSAAEGDHLGSQVGAGTTGSRTLWGVPLVPVQAGAAHYDEFGEPPMKGLKHPEEVTDYPWWPDPSRFDYADAERRARTAHRDFAVIGPWVSLFEIYCQLRGLEQALVDLVANPELVDAVLDRIEDIQSSMMERLFHQAGEALDLVFISDDVAGQTGLLMSPSMWHRHLQPRLARWCDLVHRHGLRVFYHTDGAAGDLLDPIVGCGVDVLNPIQHACPGMDRATLKLRYGGRVVFHGGIDNQHVLPFGSPDDVRRETEESLKTLGGGRQGFICCSCHNVQAGTPVDNILAMVETVQAW
jgi:uroporphyrinogen decarboxylase